MTRPRPTRNTGACRPVASCRRFAQKRKTMRADQAGEHQQPHDGLAAVADRLGQHQAAIVQEDVQRQIVAVARFRQRLEHAVVPEQQLQQQRDVADGLDVDGAILRHQPVLRQPGDADDEADDRGEDDAEAGDQQGVEQADPEGAAVGRGLRVVGDQRLADVEAGGVVPEAEAGRDVRARACARWRCRRRRRQESRRSRRARPERRCREPRGSL